MKSFHHCVLLVLTLITSVHTQKLKSKRTTSHIKRQSSQKLDLACSPGGRPISNPPTPSCRTGSLICEASSSGAKGPRTGLLKCNGTKTIPTIPDCGEHQVYCTLQPEQDYTMSCTESGPEITPSPIVHCISSTGNSNSDESSTCEVTSGANSNEYPGKIKCNNGAIPTFKPPDNSSPQKGYPCSNRAVLCKPKQSTTSTTTSGTTTNAGGDTTTSPGKFKTSCSKNGNELAPEPKIICNKASGSTKDNVATCIDSDGGIGKEFTGKVQCTDGSTPKYTHPANTAQPNGYPCQGKPVLCRIDSK